MAELLFYLRQLGLPHSAGPELCPPHFMADPPIFLADVPQLLEVYPYRMFLINLQSFLKVARNKYKKERNILGFHYKLYHEIRVLSRNIFYLLSSLTDPSIQR